jgi:hypothetical protein
VTYTDDVLDDRIRSAVPDADDPNWGEVRQRARRKRMPAAVTAAVIVAALIVTPAIAFRSSLDDLWAQAEPEKGHYIHAIAECGEGTFTFEMHPERGAVVRQGGETLARATMTKREIECEAPIRVSKAMDELRYAEDGIDRRSYAPTELACAPGSPLEIVVNPIWYHDGDRGESRMNGTNLFVAERGTRRLLASAILRRDPNGSRNWSAVHWDSNVCTARP